MGWGRMLLLGDWGQQMDIEEQRRQVQSLRMEMRRQARAVGNDTNRRLDELERENEELKLYLAATIRYLVAKGYVDVDEFKEVVYAVDSQDGSVDGKFEGKIV